MSSTYRPKKALAGFTDEQSSTILSELEKLTQEVRFLRSSTTQLETRTEDIQASVGDYLRVSPRETGQFIGLPAPNTTISGDRVRISIESPLGTLSVESTPNTAIDGRSTLTTVNGENRVTFTKAGLVEFTSNGDDNWSTASEHPPETAAISSTTQAGALGAEYFLKSSDPLLTNGRVATESTEIDIDYDTAGQVSWFVKDASIGFDKLVDVGDDQMLVNISGGSSQLSARDLSAMVDASTLEWDASGHAWRIAAGAAGNGLTGGGGSALAVGAGVKISIGTNAVNWVGMEGRISGADAGDFLGVDFPNTLGNVTFSFTPGANSTFGVLANVTNLELSDLEDISPGEVIGLQVDAGGDAAPVALTGLEQGENVRFNTVVVIDLSAGGGSGAGGEYVSTDFSTIVSTVTHVVFTFSGSGTAEIAGFPAFTGKTFFIRASALDGTQFIHWLDLNAEQNSVDPAGRIRVKNGPVVWSKSAATGIVQFGNMVYELLDAAEQWVYSSDILGSTSTANLSRPNRERIVRLDPSVDATVHGVDGGYDGEILAIFKGGNTNYIDFPDGSVTADSDNRWNISDGNTIRLTKAESCLLAVYAGSEWKVITPVWPFCNDPNFVANNFHLHNGTEWTVASLSWGTVLGADNSSGSNNPHIETSQYLSFGSDASLPASGTIRSSAPFSVRTNSGAIVLGPASGQDVAVDDAALRLDEITEPTSPLTSTVQLYARQGLIGSELAYIADDDAQRDIATLPRGAHIPYFEQDNFSCFRYDSTNEFLHSDTTWKVERDPNGGSITQIGSVRSHHGIARLTTAGTANDDFVRIFKGNAQNDNVVFFNDVDRVIFIVRPQTSSSCRWTCSVTDSMSTTMSRGARFAQDSASGIAGTSNLVFQTRDGSTTQESSAGVAISNAWVVLEIVRNSNGSWSGYADGTLIGTHTTNVPDSLDAGFIGNVGIVIVQSATTSRYLEIDYFSIKHEHNNRRT